MAESSADSIRRVTKPKMVMRSLRVPEDLWARALARCEEERLNISDVIREALRRFVNGEWTP